MRSEPDLRRVRDKTTCSLWFATRVRSSSCVIASSSDCAPSTTASGSSSPCLYRRAKIVRELAACDVSERLRVAATAARATCAGARNPAACDSSDASRRLCSLQARIERVEIEQRRVRPRVERARLTPQRSPTVAPGPAAEPPRRRRGRSPQRGLRASPQTVSLGRSRSRDPSRKPPDFRLLCAVPASEVRAASSAQLRQFCALCRVASVRYPC